MAEQEMRAVYTNTLIDLAKTNPNIFVMEADLMKASGTMPFKKEFPDRAIDVGVAEANMISIAAGLSTEGKIPFAATFGCFASRRVYDQFFISCNYAKLNVKLVGTDPGVSASFNGGTHMPFEDIAVMRATPFLTIIEPSDSISLRELVKLSAETYGCVYMRLHRKALPSIYNENEKFQFGKAKVVKDGKDAAIFALGGIMLNEALKARDLLSTKGIDVAVIDTISVKPFDKECLKEYACKTGCIVSAENHQIIGGLGSAIAEVLAEENLSSKGKAISFSRVGIEDQFGEVGTQDWLQKHFGLTAENIASRVEKLLKK